MKISNEIKEFAKDNNIFIEELSTEQVCKLRNNIMKNYICNYKGRFLWESLKEVSIKTDEKGWEKICNFVGDNNCILFFDSIEDNSMIVINNGQILYKILSEMFAFEFYITNFETSFIICFNHHDCLLCCGTAKNWLDNLYENLY